jgi:class 3 adenylate cyclase
MPGPVKLPKITIRHAAAFLMAWFAFGAGTNPVFPQFDPDSVIHRWRIEYAKPAGDSLRIERLAQLAFFYQDYLDNKPMADSLSDAAILIAQQSLRNDLLILAYNRYIEVNDLNFNHNQQKAMGYAIKALEISSLTFNPATEWRVIRNLVEVCLEGYMFDKALAYSNSALRLAETMKDEQRKAESLLLIGRSLDSKNQRLEAFSNYLDAADIAEKLNDYPLLRKCYSRLSGFYNRSKLYGQAIKYKNLEGIVIMTSVPVDFTALMYIQYDLLVLDLDLNNNRMSETTANLILDYAIRNKNGRLKNFQLALLRRHLIEANRIGALYDIYHRQFPGELQKIQATEPALYYRLQAFFNEELERPDSAEYYFMKADKLLESASNRILRSNFYNRWGQFCVRQGRKKEAIRKFMKAYDLANSASYFDFMLTASKQIEAIYLDMKDYRQAYFYSNLTRVLSDSINNTARKDQVIMAEINRQSQVREEATKREKEATERTIRQRRIERNMMGTGVGFFLILSLAIFRNYRLQKKYNRRLDEEKKRSDDLLLNILPYETAEELKLTGTAEAKRFEEVTVMFTDFKNFTQASERMSAEALVEEIHSYFSEFDKIIARHNIEKIKIIGDSYMCAGGLPVENRTHAFDIVSAALELQEFMASQKRIRLSHGRNYFELRIGVHTGPVVAGIVGIKKFAYDIWGDTVNTASRMENSGEVDRVNISGSTYQLVKDRFKCTYRGKVSAKHKGEIDMYFVEPY